jgi:hypothetical protein
MKNFLHSERQLTDPTRKAEIESTYVAPALQLSASLSIKLYKSNKVFETRKRSKESA